MSTSTETAKTQSLKAIIDAMPDMIIRISKDGVFKSFEGNTKDLYWPPDQYLGKPIEAVMPDAVARRFKKALGDCFTKTTVQQIEYALTIGNKLQHYESRMAKCSPDEVLAIIRNVTAQKETEEKLLHYQSRLEHRMEEREADLSVAEARYRSIFRHSGAPSIIVDYDFIIVKANEKFEELTGYSREQVEKKMKWTDFVHPLDHEMVIGYHFARRAGTGEAPAEYDCRIIDKSHHVKIIIIKVGLLSEPGLTIASITDVTDLKHKEQELRDRETLYSAVLAGYEGFIYTIDKKYRIRFMNENLIQRVGADTTHQICHKALHKRESKCQWCVADRVFGGNTVRFEMKDPLEKTWYYSINVPMTLSDKSVYCQCMITDIDEQKRMEEALRDSEAHLIEENTRLRTTVQERSRFGDIVGKSPLMQEVYELLLLAASSDSNVIIYGESGTGKELAAKTIHDMSARQNKKFIPINCGAIPDTLMESEFFGHKKGSFTGANTDTKGLLEQADQGSLFLDEIGEIKTDFQVKLLRAIEGGGFTPVGGSELLRPDFRIIAATNRNLTNMVNAGEMRSDFFYRIHVIPIYLPPLRKRKEDILLLTEQFLKAYDKDMIPKLTSSMMDVLINYSWPGNVRELQNVLYRFVTLKRLDLTGVNPNLAPSVTQPVALPETTDSASASSLPDAVADFEKKQIMAALSECRWNRTQTAKRLGIGLRTLQRKMKGYQVI